MSDDPSDAQIMGAAAERLRGLIIQALPDETINAAILAVWDRFTKDTPEKRNSHGGIEQHPRRSDLGKLIDVHLMDRVQARIKAVCEAWDDQVIDNAIMARLSLLVDNAANSSKAVFWEAIGSNIVEAALNRIGGRTKECSSCGRLYGLKFSGECQCGGWVS